MMDLNEIIASNIRKYLKEKNIKLSELANSLGKEIQTLEKMFNGMYIINEKELRDIANFLEVDMRCLTQMSKITNDLNVIERLKEKVDSKQSKNAIEIADNLSDMILFHKKVRENGTEMMKQWD